MTESYNYNEFGELAEKAYTGEVKQSYSYRYKQNAARDLDYIAYGDYKFIPLTDVNGRNVGREIFNGANKVAAEYITYRKVGDHATNMPATVWFGSGSQIKDSIKYKYDSCGNICEITENGHVIAKYTYDSLNRLVREDNKLAGSTTVFTYDNAGNITEKCVYDYTAKSGEELEELNCTHYSYDYVGDRLLNYNGETFAYNSLGNPTVYRGKNVAWQYGTRLVELGGTTFAYDGLGRRTKKNGITFTYDNDNSLIKQSDGLEFIYDNAGVIGVKYNGAQYFYRKDAQGNIIAILDSNGNIVVKYVYDAWGNNAVTDKDGNIISKEEAVHIGNLNPFRYRGYYYDTETGLYYLQTRYYDPEVGRFISQDSIEYADPETINGLNLYAYCNNNPVMGYDPDGTWNWGIFATIFTAVVSVAAIIAGIALTVTGVGAPVGAVLIGAGIGGLFGAGGSIVTQGLSNGWDKINWGQVAFNGATGALIGGLMASPLGPIAAGTIIAGVGLVESVGNDLFDNDFDWNRVHWGTAVITGLAMGIISGIGKPLVNFGNSIAYGIDKFTQASIPAVKIIARIGSVIATGSKLITSGLRALSKFFTQKIKW